MTWSGPSRNERVSFGFQWNSTQSQFASASRTVRIPHGPREMQTKFGLPERTNSTRGAAGSMPGRHATWQWPPGSKFQSSAVGSHEAWQTMQRTVPYDGAG